MCPILGCCQALARLRCPVGPSWSGARPPGGAEPLLGGQDRPSRQMTGQCLWQRRAHTWVLSLKQPGAVLSGLFSPHTGPHPPGFSPGTAWARPELPPPNPQLRSWPHWGRPPLPGKASALVPEPCVYMRVLHVCPCESCVCTCACLCMCVTTMHVCACCRLTRGHGFQPQGGPPDSWVWVGLSGSQSRSAAAGLVLVRGVRLMTRTGCRGPWAPRGLRAALVRSRLGRQRRPCPRPSGHQGRLLAAPQRGAAGHFPNRKHFRG